ncbi:MAG: hypothetical protein KBT03_04100 [Bacteroidales bacterium]|nr:hypothetical protein [Candidatus Scybalousia scybalohippi]
MIVDNQTGEVIQEVPANQKQANLESNNLPALNNWLQAQETLLYAKQQFDLFDYQLRQQAKELFQKYQVKSIENPYIRITLRNGYESKKLDTKAATDFIISKGEDIENFQNKKWVDETIVIKYKDGKE